MSDTSPTTFDPAIAHIRDGEHVFQVLNTDGTDWDEAATAQAYDAFRAALATTGEPTT